MKKYYSTLLISTFLLGVPMVAQAKEKDTTKEMTTETTSTSKKGETVFYNGKLLTMKPETKAIRDAKPEKAGNHTMGSSIPKGRQGCDIFTVGDKSRPRQDFIDVSSYQGAMTQRDYNTLKARGVKGVVVKLTEGTSYRNPYAGQQISMAKKAGMKVSVYHFSRFKNKAQAEAEADYFVQYARQLGLGKDTLMVNDIESGDCNNGYTTQNSVYFALRLIRTHGIQSVLHYGYQNWFDTGVLNKNTLGADSIWMAAYPYSPSANNLWFKGSVEAWQFTSTMRLPSGSDYTGYIDGNIDYTGRFTGKSTTKPEVKPEFHRYEAYATILKNDAPRYNKLAPLTKIGTTEQLSNHTWKIKGYYDVDGVRYYSLYDQEDQWYGYVRKNDVIEKENPRGEMITGAKPYASIIKENYNIWRNIDNFNTIMNNSSNLINQTYKVRGVYAHYNGSYYASLYDLDGNWQGYINTDALSWADMPKGVWHDTKVYATVMKKNYNIWRELEEFKTIKQPIENAYQKTYLVKGWYKHINGAVYYSLYNNDNQWCGYVDSRAINEAEEPKGVYISYGKDVTVVKDNYNVWRELKQFKDVKDKSKNLYNKTYLAKGLYHHINGSTYYSLYDENNQWCGYINANACR